MKFQISDFRFQISDQQAQWILTDQSNMRHFGTTLASLIGWAMIGAATVAFAQSPGVLVQADPSDERPSLFAWFIRTVGVLGFLMSIAALGVFVGSCFVAYHAPHRTVIARYCVTLLLPMLFGIVSGIQRGISAFQGLRGPGFSFTPIQITIGICESMFLPIIEAIIFTLPAGLVLAYGYSIRKSR